MSLYSIRPLEWAGIAPNVFETRTALGRCVVRPSTTIPDGWCVSGPHQCEHHHQDLDRAKDQVELWHRQSLLAHLERADPLHGGQPREGGG